MHVLSDIFVVVAAAAVIWLGSNAWKKWREPKELRAKLHGFCTRILNTEGTTKASDCLVELKRFLQDNDQILKLPEVQEFYSLWLTNPGLDIGTHTILTVHGGSRALQRLKADARRLLS